MRSTSILFLPSDEASALQPISHSQTPTLLFGRWNRVLIHRLDLRISRWAKSTENTYESQMPRKIENEEITLMYFYTPFFTFFYAFFSISLIFHGDFSIFAQVDIFYYFADVSSTIFFAFCFWHLFLLFFTFAIVSTKLTTRTYFTTRIFTFCSIFLLKNYSLMLFMHKNTIQIFPKNRRNTFTCVLFGVRLELIWSHSLFVSYCSPSWEDNRTLDRTDCFWCSRLYQPSTISKMAQSVWTLHSQQKIPLTWIAVASHSNASKIVVMNLSSRVFFGARWQKLSIW